MLSLRTINYIANRFGIKMKKITSIMMLLISMLIIPPSVPAYSIGSSSGITAIFVAIILGIILLFAFWIYVIIWIYKDAEKRGESGVLWLLIVLVAGLIGVIVWLAIRPPIGGDPNKKRILDFGSNQPENNRMCPNCGRQIPFNANVCPYCAKKFDSYL